MTTVAVVMPIGSADAYLRSTLRSIDQQDFRDFELIAVCASDRVGAVDGVIRSVGPGFPFKVLGARLPGFSFALNLGIEHVRGEFVARWDADDLCDPSRLRRQLEAFRADPLLGVVGTRVTLIDSAGEPIPGHAFKFFGGDREIRRALRYRQPIAHSAVMFRTKTLFDARGYAYGNSSEDHELYIRLARNRGIRFMNLPDVTTYYRRHPDQVTALGGQYRQFCDIAGFMTTEFLLTGNPMYVVGAVASAPIMRRGRSVVRRVNGLLFRKNRGRRD